MERESLAVLWIATLALPCLIFVTGSRLRYRWAKLALAFTAALAGWVLTFAYTTVAQAVTAPSPAELNGAALAFAALFG